MMKTIPATNVTKYSHVYELNKHFENNIICYNKYKNKIKINSYRHNCNIQFRTIKEINKQKQYNCHLNTGGNYVSNMNTHNKIYMGETCSLAA